MKNSVMNRDVWDDVIKILEGVNEILNEIVVKGL